MKLDTGILTSTLWVDRDGREVFITALLMAEPFEVMEPLQQMEVQTMKETGWVVPPGWYGFVRAAGVGITRMAGVDRESGLAALERMGLPEPDSRSKEFDGRRLVRVDGGYIILNYFKYRDRDYGAADRMRRLRERRRVTANSDAVTANSDGQRHGSPKRYASREQSTNGLRTSAASPRAAPADARPSPPAPQGSLLPPTVPDPSPLPSVSAVAVAVKRPRNPLQGKRRAKTKPTTALAVIDTAWSKDAADDWIESKGGSPPVAMFPALKKLIAKHGWPFVRPTFRFYLASTSGEFVNVAKFAAAFGEWARRTTGEPSPNSRPMSTAARTVAAVRQIAAEEARKK